MLKNLYISANIRDGSDARDVWNACLTTRGWLYIAVNSNNPELCKIGLTQKDPFKRAKSLTTAGVSGIYKPWFAQMYVDCFDAEARVHKLLKHVHFEKELFHVSCEEAQHNLIKVYTEDKKLLSPYKIEFLLYDSDPERWLYQFT